MARKKNKLRYRKKYIRYRHDAPSDIFYDLFQYLDRNEVEKSQLVSRDWNEKIRTGSSILPLRYIFNRYYYWHLRNNPWYAYAIGEMINEENESKWYFSAEKDSQDKLLLTDNRILYAVFHSCHLFHIETSLDDSLIKQLERIFQTLEHKIFVKKLVLNVREEDGSIEMFTNRFQQSQKIISDLFSAQEFRLNIRHQCSQSTSEIDENFAYFLKTPSLLNLVTNHKNVEIVCDDYNFLCDCEQLLKFIENEEDLIKNPSNVCLILKEDYLTNVDFGKELIEIFMETKQPGWMIHRIVADVFIGPDLYLKTKLEAWKRGGKKTRIETYKTITSDEYTLFREGDWTMKIDLSGRNSIEFTINKL